MMQGSTYSILLVDDSADFRALLKHYLRDLACTVDEACDGEEGVELFEQGRYDLVIMDIIMPLMDGVEAIAAIRKIEAARGGGKTKVLSLSAEGSVETGLDCIQAGADRMVLKPVSRKGLVNAVCDLLGIDTPA